MLAPARPRRNRTGITALLRWLRIFSRSDRAAPAAPDARAAEEHYQLGRRMIEQAEPARAVTCFRKAIELDAAHLDAHIDLASTMLGFGNAQAAERSARAALALDARSTAARVNLGAAQEGLGRFAEAADSYRAALAVDPDGIPALANLSAVCLRLGGLDEAERSVERMLQLSPGSADAHLRKGNLLLERRRAEQAAECFREALRLDPASVTAHCSLGFCFDVQGRFDEAMACYEQALALDPDNVQAHLNRSAIWLLREDYARGWPEYEWRLRNPQQAPVHERFDLPLWDGTPLGGRRILVYAEQGLGDEIMYASCLPEIIAQAAHCIVDCDRRLAGLLRRSFPQATVHGGSQTDAPDWLGEFAAPDVKLPIASLPRFLRRTAGAFPRHVGYLRADPEKTAAWRTRLRELGPGPKIGLSWRGGVAQTSRGARSLSLEDLLPALRATGASFVSLQYGPAREDIARLREQHGVEIVHWQEAIDDYDETAALVAALDLTLSVCTAVVHLAGALGRPVWVMAPVRPEPRYGLEGEGMRWYPTARMFRQQRYGDWPPVIAAVAGALPGFAEAFYRGALARAPGGAEAHRELSDLLSARGAPQEGLQHALQALRLRPGWARAHNAAGVALYAMSRLDEAADHLRRALQSDAGYASAHVNLGNVRMDQGGIDAAIEHYRGAIALDPGNATAHLTLAMALEEDGRHEEALASYQRSQALAPSDGIRVKIATMLPMFPRSSAEIDALRERFSREIGALAAQPLRLRDPAREVGQTAFLLPYHGRNDRDLLVKLAALYEHACPELLYTAPHCLAPRAPSAARPRIRVGFASRFFTAHSVGIWFNQLIALLAKDPDFEVVLIDLGGNADPALRAACARTLAPPADLAQARAAIAAEELDALVYADIGMDPFGYFLAFSRLAPVQCSTFGHPDTSGIRSIDYFISSALFEAADAQDHYSERLVRLNALPLYIPRPLAPAAPRDRRGLGLPEDRTIYACPMMLHKFHPDFDAAMAGILRRDARAEILLFEDGRFPRRHEGLRRRFAAAHPDVAGRLRFRPWADLEELMDIIQAVDVVLDTFYFGAGTTAFLVFALGTPLVTLPSPYARGRPTYGCYLKMGMLDCVARDAEHYIDLAVRIGTDAAWREALRRRILETCGTLYSDPAAVTELAAFLRRAVQPGGR
jgi:predicted O-linked N-acetylglucosamine transferase (SPINDLY family)